MNETDDGVMRLRVGRIHRSSPSETVGEAVPFPVTRLTVSKNDFSDPGLVQVSGAGSVCGILPSVQDFLGF